MRKKISIGLSLAGLALLLAVAVKLGSRSAGAVSVDEMGPGESVSEVVPVDEGFSVEVLVDGRPLPQYTGRGRYYVEALENAEYELRIHNPLASRVAVAVSVDGMNTIDARHTSAWDAHKWVIEPYGTIYVRGWQMSSENARRFYFTTERDSYGAKIGQTGNLGVIAAVFFRERRPIVITPAVPGRRKDGPVYRDEDRILEKSPPAESSGSANTADGRDAAKRGVVRPEPMPDDESAATGIGRTVRNGVQWIKLDLDSRPVGEVMIRYEYREALVRLGILPRKYERPDVLDRRERAAGFEPKYCPQP